MQKFPEMLIAPLVRGRSCSVLLQIIRVVSALWYAPPFWRRLALLLRIISPPSKRAVTTASRCSWSGETGVCGVPRSLCNISLALLAVGVYPSGPVGSPRDRSIRGWQPATEMVIGAALCS